MPPRVYQLKGTIKGTKPPIWRRLLVSDTTTLWNLHEILQVAFDWHDCHLHEFEIDGLRYGTDDGEGWGPPPRDEYRTKLSSVTRQGSTFEYLYDFGDNWEHKLVVEKVLQAEPGVTYPTCTGGRRAGPPEDCGGVWGYEELLAAIAAPDHPEHDELLEWVGGEFDPADFSPAQVNARLSPSRTRQ
ncbi:MAG: plasmid pRiA4b ORF-3 family protein [Acidimicrobiales bacterium]